MSFFTEPADSDSIVIDFATHEVKMIALLTFGVWRVDTMGTLGMEIDVGRWSMAIAASVVLLAALRVYHNRHYLTWVAENHN